MAALKGITVDQAADFLRMVAQKPRSQKVKLKKPIAGCWSKI